MKTRSRLAFLGFLVILSVLPGQSQTVLTNVSGALTPALPNATVTLTDGRSGKTFKATTEPGGRKFLLAGLPEASYMLEIKASDGEQFLNKEMKIGHGVLKTIVVDSKLMVEISFETQSTTAAAPAGQAGQVQGQNPDGQSTPKYTKEQIEEIRKQHDRAVKLNELIRQANTAIAAKNWADAISPLQQLTALDPANWQYFSGLGDAELNLGHYDEAVAAYQAGMQAADSNASVDPRSPISDPEKKKAGVAKMLTNQGNAYLKLRRNTDAIECYQRAAGMDPKPALAYFNLCATEYNMGNFDAALDACEKVIALDPTRADAYFIKGSLLMGSSKTDRQGRLVPPTGCVEALTKYRELAPNGPHTNDVNEMLTALGVKIPGTSAQK